MGSTRVEVTFGLVDLIFGIVKAFGFIRTCARGGAGRGVGSGFLAGNLRVFRKSLCEPVFLFGFPGSTFLGVVLGFALGFVGGVGVGFGLGVTFGVGRFGFCVTFGGCGGLGFGEMGGGVGGTGLGGVTICTGERLHSLARRHVSFRVPRCSWSVDLLLQK